MGPGEPHLLPRDGRAFAALLAQGDRGAGKVLFQHPKVLDVSSVGIPHPTRGEQIKTFVVPMEKEDVTEEELLAFCSKYLAKYKIPTEIEFIDELPKTIIGKVRRKDLRERN